MNLEQVSAALSEHVPKNAMIELDRSEQRLERFGRIAFGGFIIMVGLAILGILYTIVRYMILSGDNPWAGSLMAAFILFAGLTLVYVVFKEDLKEKRKKLAQGPTIEPTIEFEQDTNKLLNQPPAGRVASVIEDTTELLPIENKTRKL